MNSKTAIKIMLVLLAVVIIFHLCIVVRIIPYNITWGGRLQSDQEMYVFEAISIFINLFLGFFLLMKGNFIKVQFPETIMNFVLWTFVVLFALNTIGNLLARTLFEKGFAVLTLIFALLIWKALRAESGGRSVK